MDELVGLMREYATIADKDSLYARVLMSAIREREDLVRRELTRQLEASIRDREHRARVRHFARTTPLERLVAMYAADRLGA